MARPAIQDTKYLNHPLQDTIDMSFEDPNFHAGEVSAQDRWQSLEVWTRERREQLIWDEIPEIFQERFASAPYFFLSTSDSEGRCDCSFKGGGQGLIHLIDSRTFVFPDFDGNGAFMSLGNILVNPHVGCLFIDFEDGARLRVNGRGTVHDSTARTDLLPPRPGLFQDAPRLIEVNIEQVIPNCNRFIPLMTPTNTE